MSKRYVMTVLATNRVGVLAALATAVDELTGNIREIRQSMLDRFFTLMLAVEFPDTRSPDVVREHVRAVLRPFGVEIALKDAADAGADLSDPTQPVVPYILTVSGPDRPGVLRQLAFRLAQDGIDITAMQATTQEGDGSKYSFCLELAIPREVDLVRLMLDLKGGEDSVVTLHRRAVLEAMGRGMPRRSA